MPRCDLLVRRVVLAADRWLRQTVCGLGGHDYLRHAGGNRLFLQCTECGHQTPGWRIDARVAGDDHSAARVARTQRRISWKRAA